MQEDLYKIGVVAKRTGIAPERLRAWERRYGMEPAARAGHTRFYTAGQIERLTAIKALLDQGHSISQVIELDDEELQRRLRPSRPSAPPSLPVRVGLIGTQLIQAYRESADSALDVLAEWATPSEAAGQRDALPEIDCVAVYMPTLDPQRIELIEDIFEDTQTVIAFKYATEADLAYAESSDHPLLNWPATWQSLEDLIVANRSVADADAARLYSDEELLHIRSVADQAVCACPQHLVDLIGEINDYAVHAARCDGDEDHAAIADDLNAARAHLEHSLQALVEKHGLLVAAN